MNNRSGLENTKGGSMQRIPTGIVSITILLSGHLVWAGPNGIDINTALESMAADRLAPGPSGQSYADTLESGERMAPRDYENQSDLDSDVYLSLARKNKVEGDRYKRLSQGMVERGSTDQAERLRKTSDEHFRHSEYFMKRYMDGGGT